ncbi:MAG: helicase-related protein, partial [Anaerolineae bacterium]
MARGIVLRRCRDVDAYFRHYDRLDPSTLCVAVVSSEMLKLGSGWTAGVVRQRGRHPVIITHEDGTEELRQLDTFACPRCGGTLYHRDEAGEPTYPVTEIEHFTAGKRKCDNPVRRWQSEPEGGGHWVMEICDEPLYQSWRGRWIKPERDGFGSLLPPPPVRYPIAEYIKRRYRGRFQLAIVDEVHEMKGQSTDRGYAFATLISACLRTLCLTGTLFGGMATSLFYLLHRLDARIRAEFAWSEGQRFASLYGVLERLIQDSEADREDDEYGIYSGKRRRWTRVVERPGISPALVPRLLDSTVFLTLEDLGFELPPYQEQPVILEMIRADGRGPDQAEVYERLSYELLAAAKEDRSLMAEYLQTTLAWPNAPWRDEETSIGTIPALSADRLYPKEEWLVEKCRQEKDLGRRVLLFVRQTGTRDIQPRLRKILKQTGLKSVVLRSSVPTHRREAWLKRHVKNGLDVLICNPRLVQTGLDLVDFATSIFFEIEYSVYLVQQASRRTWRLGQTEPVEIYFPIYAGTMEHRAVAHVGRKVAAAQLLYGDDIAGALVQEAGADYGFLESLAREVIENTGLPDL